MFSKYFPKSLTESYEELWDKKRDYNAMQAWLIELYGMIKWVCVAKIRLIQSLKPPNPRATWWDRHCTTARSTKPLPRSVI